MSTDHPLPNSDSSDVDDTSASAQPDLDEGFGDDDGVLYDDEVTPEYGVLGFTLRELIIVGAWVVLFVLSFLPLGWAPPLWVQGISWILPIGVPTVAVFLLVLRRFSPDGIRRVGSLGIDQFASVAFSVAAIWWAQLIWEFLSVVIGTGFGGVVWVPWAQLVVALGLVVLTVFAPLVPGLKEDFQGRLVTLAHRNANPVRPVIARPRPEPAAAEPTAPASHEPVHESAPGQGFDVEPPAGHATDEVARLDLAPQVPLAAHASGGGTGTEDTTSDDAYAPSYSRRTWNQEPEIVSDTGSIESLLDTSADTGVVDARTDVIDDSAVPAVAEQDLDATNPRESSPTAQPFWILAATERDVHDERGEPLFRIGPSAWALVIEDRGGAYVVRHDDGRIGYLHDIADITKG